MSATKSLRLRVYEAWVDTWLSTTDDAALDTSVPSLENLATLFRDENLPQLLCNSSQLKQIIAIVRHMVSTNQLALGGSIPPSCDETNVLSERYDSRTNCSCTGLYPVPPGANVEDILRRSGCHAIKKMLEAAEMVNQRQEEWNIHDIFTQEKFQNAIVEHILSNSEEQPPPHTCHGSTTVLPTVIAPDRRPDPHCDTNPSLHYLLYPTTEQIKLCADGKYFLAMAAGGSLCDEGLLRAIADSGNDILIADYAEAVREETLSVLQRVGGAAMAFLKLCNIAGVITDWQFDCNVSMIIQFRVLGYYRDHAHARIRQGVYGSRMTGVTIHRHIDLGSFVVVIAASIATGEQLTEKEYMQLMEACCLVSDLVDFRSDTMRKMRENIVLRGVRGCLCEYLNGLISSCLDQAYRAIQSSRLQALVVMSFCNWAIMASHHKLYELVSEVQEVTQYSSCEYKSMSDGKYERLLEALAVYGTLGDDGPRVSRRRSEMDMLYHLHRSSPQKHLAWLADNTRSLLNPIHLRKIIDVVHFEWKGHTGDVEYCP